MLKIAVLILDGKSKYARVKENRGLMYYSTTKFENDANRPYFFIFIKVSPNIV